MTNIRCKRGKEIDLLAVNPKTGEKYHVESSVRTSPSFRIREKDTYTSKGRPRKIGLDYFAKKKFDHPVVTEKILELFRDSNYQKVLVVWEVDDYHLISIAEKKFKYKLWFIGDILDSLIDKGSIRGSRDDVLRTIELLSKMKKHEKEISKISSRRPRLSVDSTKKLQRKMFQLGREYDHES